MKKIITIFGFLLLIFTTLYPSIIKAGTGAKGWCTVLGKKPGGINGFNESCVGDPQTACKIQKEHFTPPTATLHGYSGRKYWWSKKCHWSGALILPGSVDFECDNEGVRLTSPDWLVRVPPGRCVKRGELQPERSTCPKNNASPNPNPTVGDPIIVSTGAMIETVTDFETDDNLFSLTRHYRSFTSSNIETLHQTPLNLAQNWQFNFAWELHIDDGFHISDKLTLFSPDGSAYNFKRKNDGRIVPVDSDAKQIDIKISFVGNWPENLRDVIISTSQWQVTDSDNTTYILKGFRPFNKTLFTIARPVSITTQEGYQQNLSYGSIDELQTLSDGFGRTMSFNWLLGENTDGDVQALAINNVNLPDGSSIKYSYEGVSEAEQALNMPSRLSTITKVGSSGTIDSTIKHHYENSNFPYALTGVTDARGIRSRTWNYDEKGRAISSERANGLDKTTITYDNDDTPSRVVTNALGKKTIYHYQRAGSTLKPILRLASIEGEPSSNCIGSNNKFLYDNNGFIEFTQDEEGHYTQYKYENNDSGLPSQIIEADKTTPRRTTEYKWDATHRLPTIITTSDLRTNLTYDEKGRLTKTHQTDITQHTEPYVTNGTTRTWIYTYSAKGLLTSIEEPENKKTHYFYNEKGYLNRIENALGHSTKILEVNGRGQPLSILDPNNVPTFLIYDSQGRLTNIKIKAGNAFDTWTLHHDENNNLIAIESPDASHLRYHYDEANRIHKVTNNLDETINYSRDAMGNVTTTTIQDNSQTIVFQQQQVFDELGRLISNIGADNQSWSYNYDRLNQPIKINNPQGHSFALAYDGLNRIIQTVNEEDAVTSLDYDQKDNLISHEDGRNIGTGFVRNGWGDIIREISADRGITDYLHNGQGLVIKKRDAKGIITDYSYDASGRILSITYPSEATNNITYTYDGTENGNFGIGLLTGVSDSTGNTNYHYDEQRRITQKTQTIKSTEYNTKYQYKSGRLASITYPSNWLVKYAYNKVGKITSIHTDINGVDIPLIEKIDWQPFGSIKQIQFATGVNETRTYDQDYRLKTINVHDGNSEIINREYGYQGDANISVIDDYIDASNSENYGYSPAGRIIQASGAWGNINVSYDLSGNRLDWSEPGKNQNYFIEADSNRLSNITGDQPISYSYDTAGNRINDTGTNGSSKYNYNAAGQLTSFLKNGSVVGEYNYNYRHQLTIHTAGTGTKNYLYDENGHLIAESKIDGTIIREYIWLEDKPVIINEPLAGKFYAIHTDHLDRPIMLTNTAKAEVWKATWKPWGNVYGKNGDTFAISPNYNSSSSTVFIPEATVNSNKTYKNVKLLLKVDSTWSILAAYESTTSSNQNELIPNLNSSSNIVYFPKVTVDNDKTYNVDLLLNPNGTWSILRAESTQPALVNKSTAQGKVQQNMRFPGQWALDESPLFYNWHRFYDPDIGRYITSDPIGLEGGDSNMFGYVLSNPINLKDPNGQSYILPFVLAAGIYTATGIAPANAPSLCEDIYPGLDWADYVGASAGAGAGLAAANVLRSSKVVGGILVGTVVKKGGEVVVKKAVDNGIKSTTSNSPLSSWNSDNCNKCP